MGTTPMMEIPSVDDTVVRIQSLLDRARNWKGQLSIEPALPVLEFTEGNGLPNLLSSKSPQLHNSLIEAAARRIFHAIATSASIREPGFAAVWDLFDILSICGDHGQCDAVLVWQLIEELLDVESIEGCRIAFDYLDSRRERLTAKSFKAKSLIILRSCNELLRRLSRAEDTVFCGRVYIFLFQSFPLGDKSSVNLRGEFHTENVTNFEHDVHPISKGRDDVDMAEPSSITVGEAVTVTVSNEDQAKTSQDGTDTLSIDDLYSVFWTLQKAFSNPPSVFAPEHLSEFKSGLDATLTMFKKVPRVIQASAVDETRGVKRKAGDAFEEFASTYNPKYLTSHELFSLELSDLAFQRHILVQALILLDFLLSLSEKSKERLAHLNTQKALQYALTLSEPDVVWATNTRAAIASYLQDGPEGKFYYRMVDTVLSRDKNWVRWKMESCPPIAKPPVGASQQVKATAETRGACANKRLRPSPLIALEMSFLTKSVSSSLERYEGETAECEMPDTDTLVRAIECDDLDLEMTTGDSERSTLQRGKQNKTWRLYRHQAKQNMQSFKVAQDNGIQALGSQWKKPTGLDDTTVGDEEGPAEPRAEYVGPDSEPQP